jgi:hypothetical protein
LSIIDKDLEGNLDLSDFVNLTWLDCSKNKITGLNLSKNTELVLLNCEYNSLCDLSFLNKIPCSEKLVSLAINNNSFSSKKLEIFSYFTNLVLL